MLGPPTAVEIFVRNGVRVKVSRWEGHGTVVEADCSCFGSSRRCHSTLACPLLTTKNKGRRVEIEEAQG